MGESSFQPLLDTIAFSLLQTAICIILWKDHVTTDCEIKLQQKPFQGKVQRGEYTLLASLREDADRMCKNCMVYNSEDTIFYKEAVKLQKFLGTLFGEKKSSALSTEVQEGIRKRNEMQEEWRAQEISKSVKKAAAEAKERLDREAGGTRVGYLTKEEGVVKMNIINAPPGEPTEKVVDLSCLEAQENTATSLLHNFREKRRVPGKPVQYLTYGPFGSFMPGYDSVFSSLDEAEQDLLYSCYGDELGLAYCRSVQEFARGAHDSLRGPVDSIINSLTGGGHARANKLLAAKYAKLIRQRRLQRARRQGEVSQSSSPGEGQPAPTPDSAGKLESRKREEESLLSLLESENIPDILQDTELQDKLERLCEQSDMQEKLKETSELLVDLHKEQETRLSKPLPEPGWRLSQEEKELAEAVQHNLADIISGHSAPSDVVSQESVRGLITSEAVEKVKSL